MAKWSDNFKKSEAVQIPKQPPPGRCQNCQRGSFVLSLRQGQLVTQCKACGQVENPDTREVMKEGEKIDEKESD